MRQFRILALLSFLSLSSVVLGADTQPANDQHDDADTTVVVTATRLDDQGVPKSDVPAHVTRIDREQIEASGARNLQDLLAEVAGVNLYDQVGNDVQKTLDLRGFTGGKGIAVFVDGARANDPRNNAVALEEIPLDVVDHVEITRGSASALAGGGSEAGIIRVVTRKGTIPAGSIMAAGGSFGTQQYDGSYGRAFGRFDLLATGTYDTSDGFRTNAGGDQTRWSAIGGVDLGQSRRLSVSFLSSHLDYGNPGALTLSEFQSDPTQNTFNVLDATDSTTRQIAANYQGVAGAGFSLAASLSYRDSGTSSLSTGRAAPVFGGFFLDSSSGTWSGTFQATHGSKTARGDNQIAFGTELLDGSTDSTGYFTSPSSPGSYDPSAPSSRNTAGAVNAALFLQDIWTITPRWILTAGARGDRSRVRYDESIPDPTISDVKTFSQPSFRAGVTFRPADPVEVFASYADSFLPPTPEQLFAFPGFGSNPDLSPETARTYEIGSRFHRGSAALDASVFWIDTKNEIIFDPTPTASDPFGRNVNAGATRRRGLELDANGRLAASVNAFATATWIDAAFHGGVNDGQDVPLVPAFRSSAGIAATLPAGFTVRADGLYVSSQTLDNDPGNAQAKLPSYFVANMRVGWEHAPHRDRGGSLGRFGAFASVTNLFDRTYATRGIYAFDFSSGLNETFVTPAPGRRYLAGVSWRM